MYKRLLVVSFFFTASASAAAVHAGEYYREKWFDYPDPTTLPKTTARCVQEGSMDVPCPTWSEPLRMCRATACTGHAYTTELLRVSPTFVISGPDTGEEAVKALTICSHGDTVTP
jgi:hypothetical protein